MLDGATGDGLLVRLRRRLAGPSPRGVHAECRRCGRTIQESGTCCPACGAADIARYEL